ncbi:hypothetical protein BGZ63DRAFT_425397 [Mariannaea sp. PMI_226]|nr:hypothetical protein BGZ63DRAFT_425397 [Mariannaea sp. PMI_226]
MSSSDYESHFSLANIPFGIASSKKRPEPRCVTRLANQVIFLDSLALQEVFEEIPELPKGIFAEPTLNTFAALPRSVQQSVRHVIQHTLTDQTTEAAWRNHAEHAQDVVMHLPVSIGDFTDFSCSLNHVQKAGQIMAAQTSAPPSFYKFPMCYQGRASSIVVSGTPIERPVGHFWDSSERHTLTRDRSVVFGPSRKLDYEVEVAVIVGKPLPMGARLNATDADDHIFGFVLMNDWSARDIQGFEMMPLGPVNGKNFGTSISPWVVSLEALEPFRITAPITHSAVAAHMIDPTASTYSIILKVEIISTSKCTTTGLSNLNSLFWTVRQMLAHAVSAGAPLRTGDLLATGTISGVQKGTYGCLLEETEGGSMPIQLEDGTSRSFLEDGDAVRITAIAGGEGSGVGFGECTGDVLPACFYNKLHVNQ